MKLFRRAVSSLPYDRAIAAPITLTVAAIVLPAADILIRSL